MTTYTTSASQAYGNTYSGPAYYVEEVINFATQTNVATNVFEAIRVPADTLIIDAGITVITADTAGNSGTVNLADGTTTWVVAAAPTPAGEMTNASVALITKRTADTLDVTVGTGAVNAKIRVWAVLFPIPPRGTTQVHTYA